MSVKESIAHECHFGCRIPEGRMGLGVSLLHPNARTLLERFGFERVNLEVRRYDKAYESLVYR